MAILCPLTGCHSLLLITMAILCIVSLDGTHYCWLPWLYYVSPHWMSLTAADYRGYIMRRLTECHSLLLIIVAILCVPSLDVTHYCWLPWLYYVSSHWMALTTADYHGYVIYPLTGCHSLLLIKMVILYILSLDHYCRLTWLFYVYSHWMSLTTAD